MGEGNEMKNSYMDILESNFFLYCGDQKHIHNELTLGEMLGSENTVPFLEEYGKLIKACSLDVSATYFCGMFGMTCSAYISMLSLYNVAIPVTTDHLNIQFYRNEQYHFDNIAFKLTSEEWNEGEGSESWRRTQIEDFFRTIVTPTLEQISEVAGIRIRELWGQLVVGLDFGFNKGLGLAKTKDQEARLRSDYNWLTNDASPTVFNSKKNALNFPYMKVENPQDPNDFLRIKPTCCLYYQTEGAKNKCYTCPRLKPSEREKMKKETVK